ncbi:Sirohydrochlorin ferrochelatase [Actinokineospora alba]|uniref:Sirohydrochlorin ferrochelatase n=1 Tax=Actinokineospora alba TaxID=504798 RepID=A0A1H0VYE0_9PSEU|nr:sirohydrochlorin chelatase [Actinokineospora alba]TDP67084.1 sirohydrochlorin ferrochelatase [Actinokineospora alba]SDJ47210.1 Sirohydrochlorin ferrochelatase [Actinokineospora alba]SDP83549.1 Sirohydrochlorin ferrochelatase [Actinokineospora alba]
MTLVLVAHGTRAESGARTTHALADEVRALLPEVPVKVAFADVRAPDVTTVLRSVRGPAVVVPAFLASGYHVRVDVPAQIALSGATEVSVTQALGPAPSLVAAMHDRLSEAGWRPGDAVVMAAAGSSDPRALADVRRAATLLSHRTGSIVRIGYAATAAPRISDVVAEVRETADRVAVASWLLAPGLFQRAVAGCPADVIAEPLGDHPRVADLVVRRYAEGLYYRAAA